MAVALAALVCALFCATVSISPPELVARYLQILRMYYLDDAILVGLTELRPLMIAARLGQTGATAAAGVVAVALLTILVAVAIAEWRHQIPSSVVPLAGLWSLLTFYNLTYGFVVLLPTAALFLFANDPDTRLLRGRAFWTLQATMMIDVPGAWRRFEEFFGPQEIGRTLFVHADRLLMLALFACVVVQARSGLRRRARPPRERGRSLKTVQ